MDLIDKEYQKIVREINKLDQGDGIIAADTHNRLMCLRHDAFGFVVCQALQIEYRNDVVLSEIVDIVFNGEVNTTNIPYCTPDNYLFDENEQKLYILDYKVSGDDRNALKARIKYTDALKSVANEIQFEVVTIRYDPFRNNIVISSQEFQEKYQFVHAVEFDCQKYNERLAELEYKFRNDDEFNANLRDPDIKMTARWTSQRCLELYEDENFKTFMSSMPEEEQDLFIELINTDPRIEKEKWSNKLEEIQKKYATDYNMFINRHAQRVFEPSTDFTVPDEQAIAEGWKAMVARTQEAREMQNDATKAKPSVHFIWSPPDNRQPIDNDGKILNIASKLMQIKENDSTSRMLKMIGKSMNYKDQLMEYKIYTRSLKDSARTNQAKKPKKIKESKEFGDAIVYWEQQFKMQDTSYGDRKTFLKEFCGIGNHKPFKMKTADDIIREKPKILDFNDKIIQQAAALFFTNKMGFLNMPAKYETNHVIDNYLEKIKDANPETLDTLSKIRSTYAWNMVNDFSVLMRNMLASSQYNKHNTFRIVTCANNSIFGLVLPASDIKTKRSQLCYMLLTIHEEEEDIFEAGSLYYTYKLGERSFLSVSKCMRLDKERCQRLVTSPGIFLMAAITFYNNNPKISLQQVIYFCFFTSLSVTKSILSLTEPARYMIMNSLALLSNVKGYLSEKFTPYTKTMFSVWMILRMKKAMMDANRQRGKIQLREIILAEDDIVQKGLDTKERNLTSIWFQGMVNIKEYIHQIYQPFYLNAKGLHEKNHVMMDLVHTVLQIEQDALSRETFKNPWSEIPRKQTVNLKVYLHALSMSLRQDVARHTELRAQIERQGNFLRTPFTISTLTSSKSCIKKGEWSHLKSTANTSIQKIANNFSENLRLANPDFIEDTKNNDLHRRANYEDLVKRFGRDFVDIISTKVFDELYTMVKEGKIDNRPTIVQILEIIRKMKQVHVTLFDKGQKTFKDREIFIVEMETKMALYALERIMRPLCKSNPEEMISEPGDKKMMKMEQISTNAIKNIIYKTKQYNREAHNKISDLLKIVTKTKEEEEQPSTSKASIKISKLGQTLLDTWKSDIRKGYNYEINADMSKWSAEDVIQKYFWLIAMHPCLYREEKEHFLYFLCRYTSKRLVIPDQVIYNIMNQKMPHEEDLLRAMTENYKRNWVEIKSNWLQGNLNYTSSYVHTISMKIFRDILSKSAKLIEGEVHTNSLVHSDDNQTSVYFIQNKIDEIQLGKFIMDAFSVSLYTTGNQLNSKKTYVTKNIKEFVSFFVLAGEPFSVPARYLLPTVGDCAFIGPYEDYASRLGGTQTAIKHGCPPSYAWISIALNTWVTYMIYSMLPGQENDPSKCLKISDRKNIPVEMGGFLSTDLSTLALLGPEAHNIHKLIEILKKVVPLNMQNSTVQEMVQNIDKWDIRKLDEVDIFWLKSLRYIYLENETGVDSELGATTEMRKRTILTPRKFTTFKSIKKLNSYNDFDMGQKTSEEYEQDILKYMEDHPELLISKCEYSEEFLKVIQFRYFSKKFRESLSVQTPCQLFIEQILFSRKPTIEYRYIKERFAEKTTLVDQNIPPQGNVTICQALDMIKSDLDNLPLSPKDVSIVYKYIILNDPIVVAAVNGQLLQRVTSTMSKTDSTCSMFPDFKNVRVTENVPAIVIRKYVHGDRYKLPGNIDPAGLSRDVQYLEAFIKELKLKETMEINIARNEMATGPNLKYRVMELTRFYQMCYDYLKSTDHKIKVYILPRKAYTPTEFCSITMGALCKDNQFRNIVFHKPILSTTHKAQFATPLDYNVVVGDMVLRMIVHFADSFLLDYERQDFLQKIISEFNYDGIPIKELYVAVTESNRRQNFLPLIYRLEGPTEQLIIDVNQKRISTEAKWNARQDIPKMNEGPLEVLITNNNAELLIKGMDAKIEHAELRMKNKYAKKLAVGKEMFKSWHGIHFDRFSFLKWQNVDEKTLYLVYQKRPGPNRQRDFLSFMMGKHILMRNKEIESKPTEYKAMYSPLAKVIECELEETTEVTARDLIALNDENSSMGRLIISPNESFFIRRSYFSKMSAITGPEYKFGTVSMNQFFKNQILLVENYEALLKCSILDIAEIISCDGTSNDDIFSFATDESMITNMPETVDMVPTMVIQKQVRAKKGRSYKIGLNAVLDRDLALFERHFKATKGEFRGKSNIGFWTVILAIAKLSDYETKFQKVFHLYAIKYDFDHHFHRYQIPNVYVKQTIGEIYDYDKLHTIVEMIPSPDREPWATMSDELKRHCHNALESDKKEKAKYIIDEELKEDFFAQFGHDAKLDFGYE
ncbi:MAG: RNA-dependent RNA polymerase [Udune virus]|uniref:RNA-directed RNA polymerase L n=1 Tax=Udune virus TaxID=2800946 RepID=A0A894KCR0_9VIRU|nr:MAG: RNA-dependent RNA polymerase [Udune virus]